MSVSLPVPVRVDDGRWSVDGIDMVLVPRHLITNNLAAAEQELGRVRAAALIHGSGYRSAQTWCQQQERFHSLGPVAVVRHYLDQLGRRGWGRFRADELDVPTGRARIIVHRSALADHSSPGPHGTCYMFGAWLEGALDYATAGLGVPGRFEVRESRCASTGGPHCTFTGELTAT